MLFASYDGFQLEINVPYHSHYAKTAITSSSGGPSASGARGFSESDSERHIAFPAIMTTQRCMLAKKSSSQGNHPGWWWKVRKSSSFCTRWLKLGKVFLAEQPRFFEIGKIEIWALWSEISKSQFRESLTNRHYSLM